MRFMVHELVVDFLSFVNYFNLSGLIYRSPCSHFITDTLKVVK